MHFSDLLIYTGTPLRWAEKKSRLILMDFFRIHWVERSNGVETDLAGYYSGITENTKTWAREWQQRISRTRRSPGCHSC